MEQIKNQKVKSRIQKEKITQIDINKPIVRKGFKEVFDSIFRFVAVGGDFV